MLSIQPVSFESIPLIRDLTYKVWPQTYAKVLSPEQVEYMLEMMYSPESLHKQIADGAQFIIVYDQEEPVGFASYQEFAPHLYKLHKIYILPSQQGKGTGKYVVDFVLNDIRQKGAEALHLQVNKNNKAKSFYEKLGFTAIEEIKLDIGGGFFMDDYIMEKKFLSP